MLDLLPPIESEEFITAVRAMLDRKLRSSLEQAQEQDEAEMLEKLLRGAPDDIRRRFLGCE